MKKASSLLLSVCFLLTVFPSMAQKNYSPGYVVMPKGDTLRGLIKYKRWDKNPRTISFRRETGAGDVEYDPVSIQAFFVAGEQYESAVVDVDVSSLEVMDLTENSRPELVRDTVFLQVLFKGKKKLMYLKDRLAKEHFFIDDNGIKPLIFKKYITLVESFGNTTKQVNENQEYKRQLFFYLNNCPDIQRKIESARYQIGALTQLFSVYHQCINTAVEYTNVKKHLAVETGLIAGGAITNIQFEGKTGTYYFFTESDYNKSITPSLGLFLNARILRARGLKISNDLFYTFVDFEGKGSYDRSEFTNTFSQHFLKLHNVIQRDLLRDGLLQIGLGVSTAALIKEDHYTQVTNPAGSVSELDFQTRDYELGVVGSLALNLRRITADLRYERSNRCC